MKDTNMQTPQAMPLSITMTQGGDQWTGHAQELVVLTIEKRDDGSRKVGAIMMNGEGEPLEAFPLWIAWCYFTQCVRETEGLPEDHQDLLRIILESLPQVYDGTRTIRKGQG